MSKLSLLAKSLDRMENIFLLLGYKGSGIKPSLHFPFFLPDYRGTSSVNTPRVAAKREKKKTTHFWKVKAAVDFKKWFLRSNPRIIRRRSRKLRENDAVPKPKQIQSLLGTKRERFSTSGAIYAAALGGTALHYYNHSLAQMHGGIMPGIVTATPSLWNTLCPIQETSASKQL